MEHAKQQILLVRVGLRERFWLMERPAFGSQRFKIINDPRNHSSTPLATQDWELKVD